MSGMNVDGRERIQMLCCFKRELTSTEYEWVEHLSHELKQVEVNVTAEEELESLLIEEQNETLIERKEELMHKMEIELSTKRDHEVKGAQCWTTWMERELMLKGRENLLMKEYRWFRLHLLTRNLKKTNWNKGLNIGWIENWEFGGRISEY